MTFQLRLQLKKVLIMGLFVFSSMEAVQAQCNYFTKNEGGVTVKQFPPMPIGGINNKQVALCISNVNDKNLLMLTVRFRNSRTSISKQMKIYFSNGKSLTLSSIASENGFIGGSEITLLKFRLTNSNEKAFIESEIASVVLNGSEKIKATMYQTYVADNLNCLQ